MTSIFGFDIKKPSTGGDFMPILQYDAKAGRMFRRDSVNTGNGWEKQKIDITKPFKALLDLEDGQMETGWIYFSPSGQPDFVMVPMPGHIMPPQPSADYRQGCRITLKLHPSVAGGAPQVRQLAGTSASFLNAVQAVVMQYRAERAQRPGMLPVVTLAEDPIPVTTGTGQRQSTNYQPVFIIVDWAPRPADLPLKPKEATGNGLHPQATAFSQGNGAAPVTGSQRAAAPVTATQPAQPAPYSANDFG
jgi:hypothetical protein